MELFFAFMTCLVGALALSGRDSRYKPQPSQPTALEDYEYIVVGSGPGGGPLAARLAMAGHKTLLIEAGEDHGMDIMEHVPAFHALSSEYEPMRWDFWVRHYANDTRQARDSKTTYDTPSGDLYTGLYPPPGSKMKGILYPRAGTLGGCASHNAQITIYPHEQDWESLAAITKDASWRPDRMRKYFKRLENAEYLRNRSSVAGHGFNGWLTTGITDPQLVVEDQRLLQVVMGAVSAFTSLAKDVLVKAATATGLDTLLMSDINTPGKARDRTDGIYLVPLAIKNYARNGPRDFFLQVARDGRYPLTIRTNCLVTKIRFDERGRVPRAVGVDFLDGRALYRADPRSGSARPGRPGRVDATREVIVSGGVFNTPQLLKLSGVGPHRELNSHGIPVVVDLPGVGSNLQDRYEIGTTVQFDANFTILQDCTWGVSPDPCLQQYLTAPVTSKGPYGTSGLALAVVHKSSQARAEDPADLILLSAVADFNGYFRGYSRAIVADSRHFTWLTLKAHTRNRAGTVRLRSPDPLDTPVITFNSFDTGTTEHEADEKDLQAVYEGVELGRSFYQDLLPAAGTFKNVRPPHGERETKQFIKDEAWGHHASCTCPIGADDDPYAVLDSRFRVRGTTGLRVVDASALPNIPGFFIATSVYMLSEKAADVVLADLKHWHWRGVDLT